MLLYRSIVGDFAIIKDDDFRYKLFLDGEWLGTYDEQSHAAEAVCNGEVFQPKGKKIDFDILDIPRNILEWEYYGS